MNATLAVFIERQNCFYCLKIIFSSSHTLAHTHTAAVASIFIEKTVRCVDQSEKRENVKSQRPPKASTERFHTKKRKCVLAQRLLYGLSHFPAVEWTYLPPLPPAPSPF